MHAKRDHWRTDCGERYRSRRYLQIEQGEVTCGKCQRQLALKEGKGWRRPRSWPPSELQIAEQLALFFADGNEVHQLRAGPTPVRWEAKPRDPHRGTGKSLWDEMLELQALLSFFHFFL